MGLLDKTQSIFKIPELRKRIFFTLALLVVFRLGSYVPVPGIDSQALGAALRAMQTRRRRPPGPVRYVRGRRVLPRNGVCSGHNALHLGIDHTAAARGGDPLLREAPEGG